MTVNHKIWWGTLPLTAAGALALALTLSGGGEGTAPALSQDRAEDTQPPESARTLVTNGAVPALTTPTVSVANGSAVAYVDSKNQTRSEPTSPLMLERAQALREADLAATRGVTRGQGPAEACLAQMKSVFCPIIGNMPFIRDVAGQVAMWGHFDCPTAAQPKR